MDTLTTSPSSMPNSNSQSADDRHCISITKKSFHKSDTELAAAKGFARGHKRHASEVYTDAAEVITKRESGASTPVDWLKSRVPWFKPKSRTPSGQSASNNVTVWTHDAVLEFLQKFEKGKRKKDDIEELVRLLGTNGFRDADTGDNVLHIAVRNSLLSTLKFISTQLLGIPEDSLNVENRHGDTAVHLAIKANNVETVRMLLPKCGESFPRLNSKGETLLHVACRAGYQRYLDLKDQLEAEDAAEQARRRELPAPIQQVGNRQSDASNLEAESSKRRDDDCVARITAVKEESHEMLYILLDRALADYQGRYSVLSPDSFYNVDLEHFFFL